VKWKTKNRGVLCEYLVKFVSRWPYKYINIYLLTFWCIFEALMAVKVKSNIRWTARLLERSLNCMYVNLQASSFKLQPQHTGYVLLRPWIYHPTYTFYLTSSLDNPRRHCAPGDSFASYSSRCSGIDVNQTSTKSLQECPGC